MIVVTKQPEAFLRYRKHAHVARSVNMATLKRMTAGSGVAHHTLYLCKCQVVPVGPVQWAVRELNPLRLPSDWGRLRHFWVTIHPNAIPTFMAVMESAETQENHG